MKGKRYSAWESNTPFKLHETGADKVQCSQLAHSYVCV